MAAMRAKVLQEKPPNLLRLNEGSLRPLPGATLPLARFASGIEETRNLIKVGGD